MIRRYAAVSLALVVAGSALAETTVTVETPIDIPGSMFDTPTDMSSWKSTDANIIFERDIAGAHDGGGCIKIYNSATPAEGYVQVEAVKAIDISGVVGVGNDVIVRYYHRTSSTAATKKVMAQWQYKGTGGGNGPTNPVGEQSGTTWARYTAKITCQEMSGGVVPNRLKFFFKIAAPDTLWIDSLVAFKIEKVTAANPRATLTALSSWTFEVSQNGLVQFPALTPFSCMLIQPNGRSVFTTSGTAHSVALPLTTISAGTYLLKTTTNEGTFEQKLQVR